MLREANDDRLKAVIFGFGQGEGHPGEDAGGHAVAAIEGGSTVKYLLLWSDVSLHEWRFNCQPPSLPPLWIHRWSITYRVL